SRASGDAGRSRNVETRALGWSGFAVTPTTQEETPFARLADLTTKLEATTKRLEKRALLAAFLRSLRREEVAPAVHLIVGRIFAESDSRALNVGWATLKKALASTKQATLVPRPLTILEVTYMFGQIAEARRDGGGSRRSPPGAWGPDGHRVQARRSPHPDPPQGGRGPHLLPTTERRHGQLAGDRRDREHSPRLRIPAGRRGRRGRCGRQ